MEQPHACFWRQVVGTMVGFLTIVVTPLLSCAMDSGLNTKTLVGIRGVNIVVEELQPNFERYAPRLGLRREQIRKDVETALRKAGVPILSYNKWLKTPGRPFLYIVINTHEYEKYCFAYDIKIQLIQAVCLKANPSTVTMADTWSTSMTGSANVGRFVLIKDGLNTLLERFVEAYFLANPKNAPSAQ